MARNPLAALLAQRVQAWNVTHPGTSLDPRAVLAVSAQEGLGGGIGDQGTSFGPFQLHYGGAYPSFAPHGQQASQAWATSPQGIDYALGQIASVAGGQQGRSAVANIVSRFERPANIPREISGALQAYGLPAPAAGATVPAGGAPPRPSRPGLPAGAASQGPSSNIALALRFLGF